MFCLLVEYEEKPFFSLQFTLLLLFHQASGPRSMWFSVCLFLPQRMNWRRSSVWSSWPGRATLTWTITQQSTSTMFLNLGISALSAAPHQYHPLCLPPQCPSLSSPSLWSLPTLQVLPPCPLPHSPPLPLHHPVPPCPAPHNLNPTTPHLCFPPTTSRWYRTTTISRRSSPPPTTVSSSHRHPLSWFSVTQAPLCHLPSSTPYCPSPALCSSRLLCRTVPRDEGVLLMTAASWIKRGPGGEFNSLIMKAELQIITLFHWSIHFLSINTSINSKYVWPHCSTQSDDIVSILSRKKEQNETFMRLLQCRHSYNHCFKLDTQQNVVTNLSAKTENQVFG